MIGKSWAAGRRLRLLSATAIIFTALSGCGKSDKHNETTAAANAPATAPAASATPAAPAAAPAGPIEPPAPQINVSMEPGPTQPGDVADGHDVVFLKRFQGAQIINYENLPFQQYKIFYPDPAKPTDFHWLNTSLEGQITRIVYRLPTGHTALEALRNYEDLLKQEGFVQTAEALPTSNGGDRYFLSAAYSQSWEPSLDSVWNPLSLVYVHAEADYATYKAVVNGKPVTVVLIVGSYLKPSDVSYAKKPQHFDVQQPFVVADVIVSKPVVDQMVTVKAADIADALSTKGVFDLYGIYFDTDKTEIKPESSATLNEVASLLKIDRSLKLEVSGHTDNSGSSDHNMALSQGRAQAVMQALTSQYGIDAARLTAKGYGDTKPVASNADEAGKAKNRRVELRKL